MQNKVLIKLFIPDLDTSYDIFIPVNEVIWRIKKLIVKSVIELENIDIINNYNYILLGNDNSRIYKNNEIVRDTDIRNGSELTLMVSQ